MQYTEHHLQYYCKLQQAKKEVQNIPQCTVHFNATLNALVLNVPLKIKMSIIYQLLNDAK